MFCTEETDSDPISRDNKFITANQLLWSEFFQKEADTIEELEADDSVLTEWIHASVVSHYHASSSNRMGAPDDPGAVCDPSARVYGVEGLRVADASIMPAVPCANTNFPTIMVGEKIAATILAEGNP